MDPTTHPEHTHTHTHIHTDTAFVFFCDAPPTLTMQGCRPLTSTTWTVDRVAAGDPTRILALSAEGVARGRPLPALEAFQVELQVGGGGGGGGGRGAEGVWVGEWMDGHGG